MKKAVLFFLVFLLSINSAGAEFVDEGIGCDAARFIIQSEYYTCLALTSLWEIDRENGEALEYADFNDCYLVNALDDGTLALVDHANQLVTTDLYRETDDYPLIDEGFVMLMSVFDERLYYFTDDKKLSVIDLKTHEQKTLLEDVWIRFLLVDSEGIWYSDDAGLYYLAEDETIPQRIVDADVGYFQRVSDDIYYAAATTGIIWAYSLSSQTQRQALDISAYSFAFDEDAHYALIISRPENRLYWCDAQQGTYEELELPNGEMPVAFNAMDGMLYLKTSKWDQNADGQNLQAVYCIHEGTLNLVYEEEME